jgi:hypothetical protein
MPTEDHNGSDRLHQGLPQGGVELSLDELAKGLANGTISRRKALRVFGGLLAGGMLAFIPGAAWAQDGGNSACVRCCNRAFGPGEKTPEGRSARGECISQGARTGQCPVPCEDNEICTVGPELCVSVCGPVGSDCACAPTTEGQTACIEATCGDPCNSSDDCPAGAVCGLVAECCGESVCLFPCGTLDSSSSAVQESSAWDAPRA